MFGFNVKKVGCSVDKAVFVLIIFIKNIFGTDKDFVNRIALLRCCCCFFSDRMQSPSGGSCSAIKGSGNIR